MAVPAGVRISTLYQADLAGLFVRVEVPDVRENTREDYSHQGQLGRIASDQTFGHIPIEVDLESGERRWFWRHSLVVIESFVCVECEGWFPGTDYICDGCRG
jgi:hypothetical protein